MVQHLNRKVYISAALNTIPFQQTLKMTSFTVTLTVTLTNLSQPLLLTVKVKEKVTVKISWLK